MKYREKMLFVQTYIILRYGANYEVSVNDVFKEAEKWMRDNNYHILKL